MKKQNTCVPWVKKQQSKVFPQKYGFLICLEKSHEANGLIQPFCFQSGILKKQCALLSGSCINQAKQKGTGKFTQHFLYAVCSSSYGQSEAETKWSVTATGYIKGLSQSINHSHIMTDGLCTNTQNNTVPHKSLQTRLLSMQQRVVCATLLFTFINL